MSNSWIRFLKKHGGEGKTLKQLQKMYASQTKSVKTSSKRRSPKAASRKRRSPKAASRKRRSPKAASRKRDLRRMKTKRLSKSRGRYVQVCGRYRKPDVCESRLDCYFDNTKNKCRPRKGESATSGIREGPQLPQFYM